MPRKRSLYNRRYVYSPTASDLECDFSYSCADVDNISTDIVRREDPQR